MSIELVMPSNHLILCHPLLLLPSIFPASGSFKMSHFFTSGSQNISFTFSINPSNEYSGLISFRMDRLDLFIVQGTLKSLLQHHRSKASILQCSALHFLLIFLLSNSPNTYTHICASTCTQTYKLTPLNYFVYVAPSKNLYFKIF